MSLFSKLSAWVFIWGICCSVSNLHAQALSGGLTSVLVAPGDPTPDGKDTIEFPGSFALSNLGAAYMGELAKANVDAVFSANLLGQAEVLRVGDTIPGGDVVTGLTGNLSTNDQSQALVYAIVEDANSVTHDALLAGSSYGTLRAVVLGGQNRPDTGGQFSSFGFESINDFGDVGFWGYGGGPSGIFISNHDGTTSEIASNGQNAPGEIYPFNGLSATVLRDNGQILFTAEIQDTQWGTGNDYGIYRGTVGGNLVKIARSYDAAPGTSYLLGWLQSLDMNNLGEAVVYAYLIDSQGNNQGYGIFAGSSSASLTAIAYTGQSAPGTLGHYTSFDNTLGISDSGYVAYVGYLDGAVASGVFVSNGSNPKVVALAGQTAPGGGTFTSFGLARANSTGTVLFAAGLNGSSTYNGLFLSDGIDTIKVAEAGDRVDGMTISGVGIDPKAFNDFSQVIYQAQLPSNTEIVLFAPQINWRTSSDGLWDNASNWTASLPPTANNNVTISPSSGGAITGPSANTTINSLTITGVANAGATLTLTGANSTSGSSFLTTNSGVSITNGGALTLQSGGGLTANSGVVVGSGAQLSVQTGGTLLANDGLTISNGAQSTLANGGTLTINNGATIASGGTLTGSESLTLTGAVVNAGTLTLGSNATLLTSTPAIKTSAKKQLVTVQATPALAASGNSLGALSLNGNYTQASTGVLNLSLAGTDSSSYSHLSITGNATLAGTLQIRMTSNFIPQMSVTDSYPILQTSGTLSGTFSNVADGGRLMTQDGTGSFQVNYTAQSVTLSNFVARNSSISVSGNNLLITFPSVNGRSYYIESSTDLKNWSSIQSDILGDGSNLVVTIANVTQGPPAFYRVSTITP